MQIVRQLLTESVLLALAGGVLGLAVAKLGLHAVLAASPTSLPRAENIGLHAPVLLFALAVSTAVGLLFGLAPAFKHANTDPNAGLKEGGRGSTGKHQRTQRVLALVQIALAMVLLSGAGLLFRTIQKLWAVDPGFEIQHVLTFKVGLSPEMTRTPATTRATYQQLVERMRQIPGVESADLTALVPLGRGDNSGPFWLGPHQPASMAEIPRALYYGAGPDYPRTMRIPLLQGRYLTLADGLHSEPVILVDTLMAKKYFPRRDAVGQTITIPHWGKASNVPARIVGVIGHVKQYGMDGSRGEKPQIYFSFYALPDEALSDFRDAVTYAVRTPLSPAAILPGIKKAVYGGSREQPVYDVRSMRELVTGSMGRQRFAMVLLMAFAALALVLATVGIYGVISYSTAQRVPEIGVRMALGAEKKDVLQMLVGQGFRLALTGVISGAIIAAILTQALTSFSTLLYGVRPADPLTYLVVTFCLTAAAICACYLPARRAAQLDPITALRHD